MSERTLATAEAKAAILDMKTIIGGDLTAKITRLVDCGKKLSDPSVWDGRHASTFRNETWPKTKTDLERLLTDLEALRSQLDTIQQRIQEAGGGS